MCKTKVQTDVLDELLYAVDMEKYKQAKIRNRRNQKKDSHSKNQGGKKQTNNQVLIP